MTTGPAVQSMPREQAKGQYEQQNEQRYRQQVDEELQNKHDKRSNLVLGRGKSLVLASSGGVQFSLSLSDAGIIVVTDVETGAVTAITLEWGSLANRPTNLVALTGAEGIVTIANTAAGITGQGSLATQSAVTWATQVTGVGRPEDYATLSRVYRQDATPSSPNTNDIWVVTTGGGVTPIAVRAWNGSAWVTGADITLINTAAAITGQGWGATASQPAADNTYAYNRDGAAGSPIGDWNYTDAGYWGLVPSTGFAAGNPFVGTRRSIILGAGTFDFNSQFWDVFPGEQYEITYEWWNGFGSFSGYVRPVLHIPGVAYISARTGVAVTPGNPAGESGDILSGGVAGKETILYTIPAGVSRIQMRSIASFSAANFYYRLEMRPTRSVVRGADVTGANTAAAIAGQGWGATASQFASDNSYAFARGTPGLCRNGKFVEPFSGSGFPPSWADWSNGAGTYNTFSSIPGSGYYLTCGAGVSYGGIYQQIYALAGNSYLLVGEVERRSGTSLEGAGVYISWRNVSNAEISNSSIYFAGSANTSGITSATPAGMSRYEKVVTAPAGTTYALIYAMNHFAGLFGSTAAACNLSWRECDLIPMTLVRQVGADVTLTNTAGDIVSGIIQNTQVSQTAAGVTMTDATWTDVASFSFTSVGIGVELRATCEVTSSGFTPGATGTIEYRILRGATVLKSGTSNVGEATTYPGGFGYLTKFAPIIADYNDIPSSGTYTYKLQTKITGNTAGTPIRSTANRYLSGKEFRR